MTVGADRTQVLNRIDLVCHADLSDLTEVMHMD